MQRVGRVVYAVCHRNRLGTLTVYLAGLSRPSTHSEALSNMSDSLLPFVESVIRHEAPFSSTLKVWQAIRHHAEDCKSLADLDRLDWV